MINIHLAPPNSLKRVLCLGAHCDDIEIGCGATVLSLLERHPDVRVDWAVMTSTPERTAEARAAARDFLGSGAQHRVTIRDFQDGNLPSASTAVKAFLMELRRDGDPDLVLCHYRGDFHQDHRLLGELAWQTFRHHLIWEYEIPKYDGDMGRPNVYVPVRTATMERKVELVLRHFQSQARKEWFSAETFRALMRLRGIESGAEWAEAFHATKSVIVP